jgi:hypothetical protein
MERTPRVVVEEAAQVPGALDRTIVGVVVAVLRCLWFARMIAVVGEERFRYEEMARLPLAVVQGLKRQWKNCAGCETSQYFAA